MLITKLYYLNAQFLTSVQVNVPVGSFYHHFINKVSIHLTLTRQHFDLESIPGSEVDSG